MGIRGTFSTPYHPESNGMVERVNETLEKILQKLVIDKTSQWSDYIQDAVFAYNIGYHSSTKYSPFQLLYGRQLALPPLLYTIIKDSKTLSYSKYLTHLMKTLIYLQSDAYSKKLEKKIKRFENLKLSSLLYDMESPVISY